MRAKNPIVAAGLLVLAGCLVGAGAEIPGVLLPPPAAGRMDFDRDIAPIFQQSCLRCHGPERPKGHFRLDDRAAALKGGTEGVDILPGNSAGSPLIRYVAHADDEIKMPPGNNPRLTAEQIGKLRAWIDQGAHWGAPNVAAKPSVELEVVAGGVSVHGNEGKFRELEQTRDGFTGGVKHFSFTDPISADERFTMEGHYLNADKDYQLTLALTKDDVGFVRAGVEQWRHYTENGGAFDPLAGPGEFIVNSNLFLNEGRAWVDVGLTLPHGPAVTLGYEYQYRDGTESTLDYGTAAGVNIYPAFTTIDEATHIIKLDVADNWQGWYADENARVEIHSVNNNDVEPNILGAGPGPDTLVNTRTTDRSVQGMNTLMAEKQFQDWGHVTIGYYYSRLEADDSFNQTTTSATGTPFFGNYWASPQVTLSTESHIFSIAGRYAPVDYLSFSLASQNEWTHEEGFGEADLSTGLPTVPALFVLNPVSNDSDLDKFKASQSATARFTKIPFTVLFADARFSQEQIGEFEQQAGTVPEAFTEKTDFDNQLYDIRTGFDTSPWRWISWSAQYHFTSSDTAYNHLVDSTPLTGYPAFILSREIRTDDFSTKLILRPTGWLKTTLSYDVAASDYSSATDPVAGGISPGGPLTAGIYDARTYGFNAMLTPIRSFYFSGAFTYSDSSTVTAANGNLSVVPYRGHVTTLTASAGYALSKTANLSANYSFSEANYAQDNAANGVPLGLDFTRHELTFGISKQFSKNVSGDLRYFFDSYVEPNTAGFNDYTAQGVFATIAYAWR